MGWADPEPPGGWDAPENQGGSGEILPSLNTKSIFAAGVAAERARAKKQAKREQREADRLARLERLKQMTSDFTRTSPRWIKTDGRWSWHEWQDDPSVPGLRGRWIDTGIEPQAGIPLGQQRGR